MAAIPFADAIMFTDGGDDEIFTWIGSSGIGAQSYDEVGDKSFFSSIGNVKFDIFQFNCEDEKNLYDKKS